MDGGKELLQGDEWAESPQISAEDTPRTRQGHAGSQEEDEPLHTGYVGQTQRTLWVSHRRLILVCIQRDG